MKTANLPLPLGGYLQFDEEDIPLLESLLSTLKRKRKTHQEVVGAAAARTEVKSSLESMRQAQAAKEVARIQSLRSRLAYAGRVQPLTEEDLSPPPQRKPWCALAEM